MYDGNDRFRNWGLNEYESKIIALERELVYLQNRVLTLNEHKEQIVKHYENKNRRSFNS